jgi:Mrp family chromosome partitioning ATPase
MSRYFDLFDKVDPSIYTVELSLNSKIPNRTGRSALQLNNICRVEMERVVTRLYLGIGSPRPQLLVFLAPEPGNGSHDVCVHCSDLLASRSFSSVCLVEANPNVVSLRERLRAQKCSGLTDLLAKSDLKLKHAVTQVAGGDLWLLTSGFALPDGELLSESERLLDRMNELRRCFDFVLVDAPPAALSQDALTLAQLADGAVLILPASGGHRAPARRLKEELDHAGVTVFGVILADHNFSIRDSSGERQ